MSDLLADLRRSPDDGDARVADLLSAMRPDALPRPRANEALATFLAARAIGTSPAATPTPSAAEPELVVVLGRPPAAPPQRPRAAVLRGLVPGSLGARLALTAAAAVAAVAVVVAGGQSPDIVVTPSDLPGTPSGSVPRPDDAEPTPRSMPTPSPADAGPGRTHRSAGTATTGGAAAPPAARGSQAPGGTGVADRDEAGDTDPGDDHRKRAGSTPSPTTPSGDDGESDDGATDDRSDDTSGGGSDGSGDGGGGSDDGAADDASTGGGD